MKTATLLLTAFVLAACQQTGGGLGVTPPSAASRQVYDAIMARYREYARLNPPRVMAACLRKSGKASESRTIVDQIFVTYTSEGSDAPIFPGDLARDAMQRCRDWAGTRRDRCTCHMVDNNGQNLLALD